MKKTTILALSVSALLTGCGTLPTESNLNENFKQASKENLDTYNKFQEKTIKPKFDGELESCYLEKEIEKSDYYRVFLFNTKVLNSGYINSTSELTSRAEYVLDLYRNDEVEKDILFEGENGYKFEIKNASLASNVTSITTTSYLSGYDNSKVGEDAYTVDKVDDGIRFLIAESEPGKFTYSFKENDLLEFSQANVADDIQILTPVMNTNSMIVSTGKTHSGSVVNRIMKNGFGEFGTKVESVFTDVYICKYEAGNSPVKSVEK